MNIMLDLETLDTRPTAVILSIGAVRFNAQGCTDTFYRAIKQETCELVGLTKSQSTLDWWAKQSPEAREVLTDPEAIPLFQALQEFADFINSNDKIWGNGSDFDNPCLSNAYAACGMPTPWKFWNNRCYRTICNVHDLPRRVNTGTYHNALDDAISQAEHFIANAPELIK